jgi:threonine/homoserine/homoserine lactone efflux protein
MLTYGQIFAFAGACLVLIVIPGPSVLFVVGRTLALGRKIALATVLGNALGTYTVGLAVSIGFGPLIQGHPATLAVMKFVGAVFLCWLGVQAIRSRSTHSKIPELLQDAGRLVAFLPGIRQGYVVGVTNPKAFMVFAVIMPPFLDETARPLALQMALLATTPVLIGLLSDAAWAIFADVARRWFSGSRRRMKILSITGGGLMIGLGLAMVAS